MVSEAADALALYVTDFAEQEAGVHIDECPHPVVFAVGIQRMADATGGVFLQTDNVRVLFLMKFLEGSGIGRYLFPVFLVAIGEAVNLSHPSMGHLGDRCMTLLAFHLPVGRLGIELFINVEYFELLVVIGYQAGVLVAEKAGSASFRCKGVLKSSEKYSKDDATIK